MEDSAASNSIIVEPELIKQISFVKNLLLESSAEISNSITRVERHCPYADDEILKNELFKLKSTAVDLSLAWDDLAMELSVSEIYC